MKKFLSLVIAICFTGSVYAAPIQQKVVSNKQKTTIDFNELVENLSMTDNQKEELKNLLTESSSKKATLKQEIKVKADAIDAELLKENYDSALVDSLTKDIQSLTSEYSTINIESKNKIRNILDYNQYMQYTQMENKTQVVVEKAKSPEALAQEKKAKAEQAKLERKAQAEQLKAEEKAKKEQAKLETEQLKAEEKAKKEQAKLEAEQLKAEEKAKKEQAKLEAEQLKAEEKAKKEQAKLEAEQLKAEEKAKKEQAKLETEQLKAEEKAKKNKKK